MKTSALNKMHCFYSLAAVCCLIPYIGAPRPHNTTPHKVLVAIIHNNDRQTRKTRNETDIRWITQ